MNVLMNEESLKCIDNNLCNKSKHELLDVFKDYLSGGRPNVIISTDEINEREVVFSYSEETCFFDFSNKLYFDVYYYKDLKNFKKFKLGLVK